MKLLLTNYSHDISLTGEEGMSYVVFTDVENGRTFRLPAPQEMIERLTQILSGEYSGEPAPEEQGEEEEASADGPVLGAPEDEPEEEEESVPPPQPLRKKLVLPKDSPMRAALSRVRAQMEKQTPEGKVPQL